MAHGATLFRMLNIITSMLLFLGGILLFVRNDAWNSSILVVYICCLGALTFLLEFMIPEVIVYNMDSCSRCLDAVSSTFRNMGALCLAWKWFNIVVGCIIMAIGLFYAGMHFLGATPSPSMSAVPNSMENDTDEDYPHDSQYVHSEDNLN
ncbi:hypothetical protein BGX26_004467 [Mortierella sp. AD094]|nr:hypothetical protein BGX26_004467 [Mortierella sp. AD094]